MLNRPLCKRTFPGRTASSPTQLSRALTSLRTPDHAVPNDAALCRSRGERVQLSCFYSIPSYRWVVGGSPGAIPSPWLDASLRQGDACSDEPARPYPCSITEGRESRRDRRRDKLQE